MIEKLKDAWSTVLGIAVAVLSIFLLFERNKRKKLEAENLSNDLDVQDATLKEKQKHQEESLAKHKAMLETLKKPEEVEMSPEEVEKHWNKGK